MMDEEDMGASASRPGSRPADHAPAGHGAPRFDPSRTPDPAAMHPEYGSCDGFGPLWTCSVCTGVLARNDGTFVDERGLELTLEEASATVGDFLMERAELAALAAFGCCDEPAAIVEFMRVSLILPFPGQPWRRPGLFERALRDSDGPRMAETNEDSARGEAGPARAEGIAQPPSEGGKP